nr:hypothetical protein [uncultured Acetobacterium sp.]
MLTFDMTDTYKGMGVSSGLDRGILVFYGSTLLLEEGMGLGACALQTNGYTYFSSVKSINKIDNSFEIRFEIDQQLVWAFFGVSTHLLTRMLEKFTTLVYMKQENRQMAFLKLGSKFRKIFKVKSSFLTVPSLAEGVILAEFRDNSIALDLSLKTTANHNNRKFFIMNELGGSYFDQGLSNGKLTSPPTGWQKIEENVELYSQKLKLAFSMAEKQIPQNVASTLYWGRESISDSYCWSGFESELSWNTQQFDHYKYVIKFKEVSQ